MKTKMFKILFSLCFAFLPSFAFADDIQMGVSIGPAVGFNADFNDENNTQALHLQLGFNALYEMPCYSSFCKNLYANFDFDYIFPSNYQFGSTQVQNTGLRGNYSESAEYFSGSLGLRKEFLNGKRINPFAGFGIGLSYLKLGKIHFADGAGDPIEISIDNTSSLNFTASPSVGISYKLSHKMAFDFGAKLLFRIPEGFSNSVLIFPLGVKLNF